MAVWLLGGGAVRVDADRAAVAPDVQFLRHVLIQLGLFRDQCSVAVEARQRRQLAGRGGRSGRRSGAGLASAGEVAHPGVDDLALCG